jgi:DNA gyrase/topoisomerase IV subunit B
MDTLKVTIDKENNKISIFNNGKGIPVEVHKEEKVYVPELIFGHLLTSSNYDDDERKVTGGRNGYGAKLCNIFSNEFVVETADKQTGLKFKQVCKYYFIFTSVYEKGVSKQHVGEIGTSNHFKFTKRRIYANHVQT